MQSNDDETLDIVQQRAYKNSSKANEVEVQALEEIQESLTKAEKGEFRVTKKQRDTAEECRTSFKQEYKQKKEALKVLAGKRSARTQKRASKTDTP